MGNVNTNFKPALGINNSDFIFVEGYALKIVHRQWVNKLELIEQGHYKCHIEYSSTTFADGNDITIGTDDC